MRIRRTLWGGAALWSMCTFMAAPAALSAQGLADFDYENLAFRGFGAQWGYIWPSRVEPTQTLGLRMDLGYLGPGVRIVPTLTYWKSDFKAGEIHELERRVAALVATQTGEPAPSVNLGRIDWSDVALAVDGQVVWRVPFGVLTYLGAGAGVHLLNGNGDAINGTFVEDLLDSVTAGFDLAAGLEYLLSERFRVSGEGRFEILGDLHYYGVRFGAHIMTGASAPGEERTR